MGLEIERKFLVNKEHIMPLLSQGVRIEQGYLADSENAMVRVRTYGARAYITIKSSTSESHVNEEFEYPIPFTDCEALLDKCQFRLSKTRYLVAHNENMWEVDMFTDGLVMAEFEHTDKNKVENVKIPKWVTSEVTEDKGYSNFALAKKLSGG